MATSYNPGIVTSGLVLCLDAGNTKSYPGSGSSWTDLSGNGNTGTLNNSPVFSSNNGGYLTFNGTNQFVSFANSSTLANAATTIEMWINTTSVGITYQLLYGSVNYPKFYLNTANLSYYNVTLYTGGTISASAWYQIVLVSNSAISSFYTNGALNGTGTGVSWSTTASTTTIGKDPASSGQYFSGNIGLVRVYNTALTSDQILQNYNALRGRFGL